MAKPKIGHCSNRSVVVAAGSLHSPKYDDERDPGTAWYEMGLDANAMCFWGMCDHKSYNAWVTATDKYINGTYKKQLKGHLHEAQDAAHAAYGGLAFPVEVYDRFKAVAELINEWNATDYYPNKTWKDDFRHPFATYWWGQIRQIIDYFDRAACLYDTLDDILIEDLKRPSLAGGAPVMTLEDMPGGYLGGSGGASGTKSRSPAMMAVGIMAIGAAGYFGYKVLTE